MSSSFAKRPNSMWSLVKFGNVSVKNIPALITACPSLVDIGVSYMSHDSCLIKVQLSISAWVHETAFFSHFAIK